MLEGDRLQEAIVRFREPSPDHHDPGKMTIIEMLPHPTLPVRMTPQPLAPRSLASSCPERCRMLALVHTCIGYPRRHTAAYE